MCSIGLPLGSIGLPLGSIGLPLGRRWVAMEYYSLYYIMK
jgi:hypothetical protein